MPLKAKVRSLKEECFKSITNDIDSYWCKDYMENYPDGGGKYMHVVGPFDDLPARLKHELVLYLGKQSRLRRHHLELLIDDSTAQVDFSMTVNAPPLRDALLELVCIRCKNLTEMNIEGCKKVTPKMLLETFPNFPKLRIIRMNGTKCTDRVLHVIGHYCPKVIELHVNFCGDVSDKGIRSLLFGTDKSSVQCPDLMKLGLEATKVTAESVKLALLSLPKLQKLESDLLLEALYHLHEEEFTRLHEQIDSSKQYRLTRLGPASHMNDVDSVCQYLSVAAAYCPIVNDVTLFGVANDESLLTVSRFEALKSLSLLQCFESVTFENGVLPLLQIRGPHLHTLLLEVPEVDVKVVGYFCPNLKKLSLEFHNCCPVNHLKVRLAKHWKPFINLHWLRVGYQKGVVLDKSCLLLLLSNCLKLRYLCLKNLDDLRDDVMTEIYGVNALENLENLSVVQCDNLTMDSVWPLLIQYNELNTLELDSCRNITRQDADQIRQEIRKQKSSLDFTWT